MKSVIALAALSVLFLSAPAKADFAATGFTVAGFGSATFSLSGSTLSITLENLSSVAATGNLLSGVGFDFTGTGSSLTLSNLVTPTGLAGYGCTGSGAGTVCTAQASVTSVPWLINAGTGTIAASAYDITGFTGTPKGTLIANDSILSVGHDGLSGDQPYFKGPVTFTLTVSGTNVAGITGIKDVFLGFGTAGDGVSTPEPGFYGVLALGISGLVMVARRRRNSAA